MFKGTATALITPFTENGVDFDSLEKLLDFQLNNGIDALVVLGTTGEPPTMTKEEKLAVMKFAIKKVDHKIPVILGTGSTFFIGLQPIISYVPPKFVVICLPWISFLCFTCQFK